MHLLTLFDLDPEAIAALFDVAASMKAQMAVGVRVPAAAGRTLGLLFEKPSLRSRVSFEAGMVHLGGASIYLGADAGWGQRESLEDFARVFSSYVDLIAFRGYQHTELEQFARHSQCPVINALTDAAHPCQALGDLFTLHERLPALAGEKLVFVGDANNVARSLATGCAATGMDFVLTGPDEYRFDKPFMDRLFRTYPQAKITQTNDAATALDGAAAVYTDVWASMGFESQWKQRAQRLADYRIDQRLMQLAGPRAVFMHCLPARRGEEVTDEVIDGDRSIVIQQAENRLHIQKALIVRCLGLQL